MDAAELRALDDAPLDAALGLSFHSVDGDSVVLRFDPSATALVPDSPSYVHGGGLATCVDTAGWYAVVLNRTGTWVAVDLRTDFLRPALAIPHRVTARCRRAGRTLAVADVEISPWDDAERTIALGRVQFARVAE